MNIMIIDFIDKNISLTYMRVEMTDGVGAPWPMTAQAIPTTEGLLPALSMVIVKV